MAPETSITLKGGLEPLWPFFGATTHNWVVVGTWGGLDDFPWRLETPTNTDICFRSRMPHCRVDPGKIILGPILYRTYDWKGGSTPPFNCKPSSNSEFQPQMATLFHIWSCRILKRQNVPLDEWSYVIRCISENGNSFAPFWNLIWISKRHGKSSIRIICASGVSAGGWGILLDPVS